MYVENEAYADQCVESDNEWEDTLKFNVNIPNEPHTEDANFGNWKGLWVWNCISTGSFSDRRNTLFPCLRWNSAL